MIVWPISVWLLAAATTAVLGIIVYFVVSSRAEARANEYKRKVLLIISVLKERLGKLKAANEELQRQKAESDTRVMQLERELREAREPDADLKEALRRERVRVEKEREAVVELQRQIDLAKAELEHFQREESIAERLNAIAGVPITTRLVTEVATIRRESLFLSSRVRPSAAMSLLDQRLLDEEQLNERLTRELEALRHSTS